MRDQTPTTETVHSEPDALPAAADDTPSYDSPVNDGGYDYEDEAPPTVMDPSTTSSSEQTTRTVVARETAFSQQAITSYSLKRKIDISLSEDEAESDADVRSDEDEMEWSPPVAKRASVSPFTTFRSEVAVEPQSSMKRLRVCHIPSIFTADISRHDTVRRPRRLASLKVTTYVPQERG